ncbi:MAG: uroporphyrinogen decarboxylase [Deltaproteobacteria bacterium]|nr:uroporphyrinogen decarboxylase [Deltaproteobacteria bacterium]
MSKTRFLDACHGKPTDCTPVWLMRQAGRYQPSYRALRKRVSFFELCETPELAAQVTVQAVEDLDADAAIIFSDILVPLMAMGAQVEMTDRGPKLEPIRDRGAIDRLRVVDPAEEVPYVMEAIKLVNQRLDGLPQIGFAGAPLTLASYMVEGGASRGFPYLKGMLFGDPKAAHTLLEKLADQVARHLRAQVEAGCHVVQLFDTWAGILDAEDYRNIVLPHIKRIFDDLADLEVPRIFFGTGLGHLLEVVRDCGADIFGVDWVIPLSEARRRLGKDVPLQGNLDPCSLFAEEDVLEARIQRVLDEAGGRPHIFNLGHGILPQVDPARARFMVDTVHRLSAKENA